jgi:signal transduction histidine kinase
MSAITQLRPARPGSPDPALLYAAVEAFPGSLAVIDSGVVVYVNPAWTQVFECKDPLQIQERALEDFIPMHLLGLFHTPPAGRNHVGRDEAGRNDVGKNVGWNDGETVSATGEFAHLRQDGTQVQLRVACTSFRVRGRVFQVLSASDAGLQKQAETELREAQRLEAIGRLSGGVAHDFNNLLTGIMLYCDLLIAELEKDSRSQHHVRQIRIAGEHGARLVEQLLAVARPRAQESRVVALNGVVTGLEELLTRLIGENIVLATSLAADLGAVRMDPAHVQQILLNLVLNARDAMPDGGHITLTTRNCTASLPDLEEGSRQPFDEEPEPVPCVELTVSDTGCGMDSEVLSHAFEPFFTTKESGRGNGLGLATACRLAKLEGGTILAESQLGIGTRVSLLLPRVGQAIGNQHGGFNPDAKDSDLKSSKLKVER